MAEYYHQYSRASHHRSVEPAMIRPSKPEDWEPYREIIGELYTSMKLKDVMTEMQLSYHFKAT